ncbi:hypothetical protein DPMN_124829 [Dreissena polymorpha]|uniref:Uncharacterized protein n=1 Tax=Dreissena polymorpha TaxID=45954 RepID=A0A9D4GX35_DREPO|nr:hypothetical protein DPMN_124829 [Dreissena polymorpha]
MPEVKTSETRLFADDRLSTEKSGQRLIQLSYSGTWMPLESGRQDGGCTLIPSNDRSYICVPTSGSAETTRTTFMDTFLRTLTVLSTWE